MSPETILQNVELLREEAKAKEHISRICLL